MTRAVREHGFALVTVLLTLGFLALLGTALVGIARQGAQRVANLLDGAVAEAVADGALHQAIFALLDTSDRRWHPDGRVHVSHSGQHVIELRVDDENGKVNPNIASAELLQALLVQLGAEARAASALAAMIVEWRSVAWQPAQQEERASRYAAAGRAHRPTGAPFEHPDELGAVLGMTADLLARLRPHLTLYTQTDPDSTTTDPIVAAALGVPVGTPARRDTATTSRVVTVSVAVRGPRRMAFAERVVVRTNALVDVRRHEILSRERLPAMP